MSSSWRLWDCWSYTYRHFCTLLFNFWHPAGQVLLEKGRIGLVLGQFQAVIIAYSISAIGTLLIALILKKAGIQYRVSNEEENKGLDLSEHGEKSYI